MRAPTGCCATFNDAGVLAAADVHVAVRLAALARRDRRGGRAGRRARRARARASGTCCVDLDARSRETATVDSEDEPVDLADAALAGRPRTGSRGVAASPLVAAGERRRPDRPLRLVGSPLYLDRYWREERRVADRPARARRRRRRRRRRRCSPPASTRLFAGRGRTTARRSPPRPRCCAGFAVVAGGPGTGKTTTVARIVALLAEQAGRRARRRSSRSPRRPARPRRGWRRPSTTSAGSSTSPTRSATAASALRRLDAAPPARLAARQPQPLPPRPRQPAAPRRRDRRRDLDGVAVADGPAGRGRAARRAADPRRRPGQLASIEAGAVLGDIVGPAADALLMRAARERLEGRRAPSTRRPAAGRRDRRRHRRARPRPPLRRRDRRAGRRDPRAATPTRRSPRCAPSRRGRDLDRGRRGRRRRGRPRSPSATPRSPRRARGHRAPPAPATAARRSHALGAFRVLCAHRRGAARRRDLDGARSRRWLARRSTASPPRAAGTSGRPLLVTENDYALRLYNGDTGVVVAAGDGRVSAAFERRGEVVEFSPARLAPSTPSTR